MSKPLFPLRRILATPGSLDLGVTQHFALGFDFYPFLHRHHCSDGDMDHRSAIRGLKTKARMISSCAREVAFRSRTACGFCPPATRRTRSSSGASPKPIDRSRPSWFRRIIEPGVSDRQVDLSGDPGGVKQVLCTKSHRRPVMYPIHPCKSRAVTRCLAVSRAHVGEFGFQPDATGRTRPSTIYHLFQEVTMIPPPTLNGKAAVAAAALRQLRCNCFNNRPRRLSGAQTSALDTSIVPPPRRKAMGFRPSIRATLKPQRSFEAVTSQLKINDRPTWCAEPAKSCRRRKPTARRVLKRNISSTLHPNPLHPSPPSI
jgi:hypothetical protein